jgi:hypothetical protein
MLAVVNQSNGPKQTGYEDNKNACHSISDSFAVARIRRSVYTCEYPVGRRNTLVMFVRISALV